jgi:hypothetical protein
MAIRIREVNGRLLALCAARSVPKEGDLYLHDGVHHALWAKFARDQKLPWAEADALVEAEESNNPYRTWWDGQYGPGTEGGLSEYCDAERCNEREGCPCPCHRDAATEAGLFDSHAGEV